MAKHWIDPLSGDELAALCRVISADRRFSRGQTRFHHMELIDPNRNQFNATAVLGTPPRDAIAVLFDRTTSTTYEVVAAVRGPSGDPEIREWREVTGQPCIVVDEFLLCEQAVLQSEGFKEAMRKRGVDKWELLMVDPWSAGSYDDEDARRNPKLRLARALTFVRRHPTDNGYARPVQGLMVLVDLAKMEVIDIKDTGVVELPPTDGNWSPSLQKLSRPAPKPLCITQPEGPSFKVDGYHVEWCGWDFRIGWSSREGLILHQLCVFDYEQNERRSVIHRASVCDMVVPYGDPDLFHARKNAFDSGEYGLGFLANSLELGCDCLGLIRYFDVDMLSPEGEVMTLKHAVCMHEEDFGVQWKHTDFRTGEKGVVRSRRLVVSFFATVGNYDYGFFWYFYLDGTVQLEVKLTGIVNTGSLAVTGQALPHGTEIAPRLYAPIHQHSFSVRLDMAVDGQRNSVSEVEVLTAEPDPKTNPFANAFYAKETHLKTECGRKMCFETDRYWKVWNGSKYNHMGKPTGFKICPEANATIKPHPTSAVVRRAGYMTNHFWVTPYDPKQKYAAGEYPNQRSPDVADGLPAYVRAGRSVDNQPLTVWYTLTVTHVVRAEDWPVMPCHYAGFRIMPVNFFRQNPTVSMPQPTPGGCHSSKL